MNEEKLFESGKFMIRHFKRFSRRHWILSPRFDFIYDFIDKLEKFQDLSLSQKRFIKKKFISCRYKLCALEYHEKKVREIEKKYKKILKSMLNQLFKEKATLATITPEILFEFEAYLFQCKAFLDIYSQAIGNFFQQRPTNIKRLKRLLRTQKDQLASELLRLVEKNKWLEEFDSSSQFKKSKRDIVAHYSVINLSWINVQKLDRKKFNTIRTRVGGKMVLDYMWKMTKEMRTLMMNTIKVIEKYYK